MSSTLPELDWSLYCADYEDQLATLNVDFGNFVNDDEIILSPNDIGFKAFAVADEQQSFQIQHNPTSDSFISLGELDDERKPARNFGEVYETAYQIKQPSKDLLESTAVKEKGLDCTDAKEEDLRPNDSAIKKGRKENPGSHETWLYDILSASVTCKTTKQLESVNKFLVQKAHIVQAKNRFVTDLVTNLCLGSVTNQFVHRSPFPDVVLEGVHELFVRKFRTLGVSYEALDANEDLGSHLT
jgi:hypothetical protein